MRFPSSRHRFCRNSPKGSCRLCWRSESFQGTALRRKNGTLLWSILLQKFRSVKGRTSSECIRFRAVGLIIHFEMWLRELLLLNLCYGMGIYATAAIWRTNCKTLLTNKKVQLVNQHIAMNDASMGLTISCRTTEFELIC